MSNSSFSRALNHPLHNASPDYGYNDHGKTVPPSPLASSKHSTSSRISSSRLSRERPRNAVPTARELMQMLVDEQETTRELQQQLTFTTSQLAHEQDRADTAERKIKDAVIRFNDANEGRISAQADAARLREELKLYKNALEEAQKEIFKAQNILKDVEGRRREVEEEATQLRRKLRKLNEEMMTEVAREEGRKLGLQEGLEVGKDIGYLQGRNQGYVNGRSTTSKVMERYLSSASESEARRSRGEPDLPPESDAPYTATTMRFPPSGGDSGRSSSLSSSEREVPRYSRTGGTRTGSARMTTYPPAQPHAEIPPDGFIPEVDASMIIRLPHELVRPPPTPTGQSLLPGSPSPQIPAAPVPGDVPLMIPQPRSPGNLLYELSGERQYPAAPQGEQSIRPNSYHSCRWMGGPPCDDLVPGRNREMGEHLRIIHGFVGHERDIVQCEWENCDETMQRMNIPRHILSRHLLTAPSCRICGKRFSRSDVVARHERTCSGVPPVSPVLCPGSRE